MARLIDAEALERSFRDVMLDEVPTYLNVIVGMIRSMPTVDAEPVRHGRWIAMQEDYGDVYYVCSECNEAWFLSDGTPVDNNMHYCTRCGARMIGGETDGEH